MNIKNVSKIQRNAIFDVVVVGSGPAGVHAAYPLVKVGLKVAIVDGGLDSKKQDKELREFPDAKLTKNSHYYSFIEDSSHLFNKTFEMLKIKSNIEILQTLAKGGLSEVWHGICDYYSSYDLKVTGLPVKEIRKEYLEVGKLIGLKVKRNLDFHDSILLSKAKEKKFPEEKIYQVPIAFPYLTANIVDQLLKNKNFSYIPNRIVFEVEDKDEEVQVRSYVIDRYPQIATVKCKFLILAAGSINTTRILLRSFDLYNYKTDFLTKATYLTACLHTRTLFKKNNSNRYDLGQLAIFNKSKAGEDTFTQLYELNPEILDKVLRYIPLPMFFARRLLSIFASSIVIADIRMPDFLSADKFCRLVKNKDGTDTFEISYTESDKELDKHKKEYDSIIKQLKNLGLVPLKTIYNHVTSHYAGGVPFATKPGRLSVNKEGKLHQANRIYVADSATWKAIPAKPPTLTIMANASRIGKNVLKNF